MNLKFIALFSVLVFASVGILGVAHAQDDEIVKANIPFDFYAGKQKMPAGSYRIGIDLETEMISVTDESGKHKIFLIGTSGDEGSGNSLLVFKHSGDVYALEELKSDAYNWVFQTWVPVPPIESRNALSHVEVALNR
jgi:hypothetical protein